MNTMSYRNPKGAIQETRSRATELYFNGACLVRSILRRRFRDSLSSSYISGARSPDREPASTLPRSPRNWRQIGVSDSTIRTNQREERFKCIIIRMPIHERNRIRFSRFEERPADAQPVPFSMEWAMGPAFSDFTFSLCLRRIQTSPRRLKRAVIEQL